MTTTLAARISSGLKLVPLPKSSPILPRVQRDNLLFELLERACANGRDDPEWELIHNYWTVERPALASKTRETIDADFTGMFDPLQSLLTSLAP